VAALPAGRPRAVPRPARSRSPVGVLGKARFIKSEDEGESYYHGDDVQPPDFRVILDDGRNLLVEVKNWYFKSPTDDFKVRQKTLRHLSATQRWLEAS
jgi:hypothetical protein